MEWRNASQKDIENMTIYEAIEILEKYIVAGEEAIKDPTTRGFAPRPHMTQALKLVVTKAKANTDS